ncbi:MAG: CsbD family protein [Planctomycetia bacterium]|nr:CsbD family protein [Planctomycetia bacterium]
MNSTTMAGNWKQMKGKLKEKWGKLTDDDFTVLEGKQEQLAGILEKRYGYAKEQAKKDADEFYRNCGCCG